MKNIFINMVRKSERYLKTDMLYVVTNGFWLSVGQVAAVAIVFLSAVAMAYFLPKDVYGNYKFILSATSILGSLSLAGMGTAVVQAVAQGREGVLRDAIRTSLRWGIIVFVIALALAGYYFWQANIALGASILVAGITTPLISAFGLSNSFFSGRKDFKKSTFFAILSQFITTALVVLIAILFKNAIILVAVNFLASAILAYFIYVYVERTAKPNNIPDDEKISYGKHISYMNFFGTVANQFDKILVFHWLGAVELAVYAFAIAIPEQIKGSYKNLFNIALPKMSNVEPSVLRKSVIDKTLRLTLITAVLVIAYYFIAPYVYQIFFPKYLESVWYSQVYMLGLITIPGISLIGSYFNVREDTRTLYKLTVLGNVITLFLTFILIYSFGITGAVIENCLSWLIILLINILFFVRTK